MSTVAISTDQPGVLAGPLPAALGSGQCTLTVGYASFDTADDPDSMPEYRIPKKMSLTLTPNVSGVLHMPDGKVLFATPTTLTSDNGTFDFWAIDGVHSGVNPSGWNWTAYLQVDAEAPLQFTFSPDSTTDEVLDLGPLIPVNSPMTGQATVVGRGISSLSTTDGDLVVTYTDGRKVNVGPLPPGPKGDPGVADDASMAAVVEDAGSDAHAALVDVAGHAGDEGQPTDRMPSALITCQDHAGQDLTTDGVYWYWGHNNGAGLNATINKIDPSTGQTIASFDGPPHSSSTDYSVSRGTLLAASGAGEVSVIWEISTSGEKLREWNFSSLGVPGFVAAVDDSISSENAVWVFTRDGSHGWEIDLHHFILHDDGTWTDDVGQVLLHTAANGTVQGCAGRNGRIYLLTDDPSLPARRVSRFTRIGDVAIQDRTWIFPTPYESEGIMFWKGMLHYGDGAGIVYRAPYQPLETQSIVEHSVVTQDLTFGLDAGSPKIITGKGTPYNTLDAAIGTMYLSDGKVYLKTGAGMDAWDVFNTTSAAPATYVSDSFDRPDSSVTLGDTDTGQNWQLMSSTDGSTPTAGITNGRAYFPAPTAGGYAVVDSGVSDCVIEVTYYVPETGCGVAFRMQDAKNGYVANAHGVYRIVNGSISSGAEWSMYYYSSYVILNQGDRIRIVLSGDNMSGFILPSGETDWVACPPIKGTSASDGVSMFSSATRHGIRSNSATAKFDDFVVKAIS